MRARNVGLSWTLAFVLSASARRVSAQESRASELSAGYVYLIDTRTDVSFAKGWTIAGARKVGKIWAVIQFDNSMTELPLVVGEAKVSIRSLMSGAGARVRFGRLRQFAQLTAGPVHQRGVLFGIESTVSRFALQPGLGIDYLLTDAVAVRAGFDDQIVASSEGEWTHQLRSIATIVYSFR
jgi:hypothetical protein